MKGRILHFPRRPIVRPDVGYSSPFDAMTDAMVIAQAEAGTLSPAIVEALLMAVRQPAREIGR